MCVIVFEAYYAKTKPGIEWAFMITAYSGEEIWIKALVIDYNLLTINMFIFL